MEWYIESNQNHRQQASSVQAIHHSFSVRESLQRDIRDMLKIIRKSDSPYASLVVVVRKVDGSNRVCVDYRN